MSASKALGSVARWEVVAVNEKGGIIVREAEAVGSPKKEQRLATGAIVEELELLGERLHFRKLSGGGPEEGWVGIRLPPDRELVRRLPDEPQRADATPPVVEKKAVKKAEAEGQAPQAPLPALDPVAVREVMALAACKWLVIAKPWVPFREHPTRFSRVVGAAVPGQVLKFPEVQVCPVHGNPYGRHDWVDKSGRQMTGWISVDPDLLQRVQEGLATAALASLALDDDLQVGDLVAVEHDFISASEGQKLIKSGQLGLVRETFEDVELPALVHFDHQDESEAEWVSRKHFASLRVVRSEVSAQEPRWAERAAQALCVNGFCLIRSGTEEGLAPASLCGKCAEAVEVRLQKLLQLVEQKGLDPNSDIFEYAEVCARQQGCLRYDVAVSTEEPGANVGFWRQEDEQSWRKLHQHIDRWAQPVLFASGLLRTCPDQPQIGVLLDDGYGDFDRSGCVTSFPGAPSQDYHQDGGVRNATGLINAFMPLVPITSENGPTQFLPFAVPPRTLHQEDIPAVAPTPGRGELLLFDYRVFHKGLSNLSYSPRPVAYVVYARPGMSDKHNFPNTRLENHYDDDDNPVIPDLSNL